MSESTEELRKRVVSWGTDYTAPNQVRVRGAKVLLDDMLKYIKELEHGHDAHFKNQADRIEEFQRRWNDLPWEEIERLVNQANMHSLVPPEERDLRDQVLAAILALREQEEGNE